jgi:dolichyl-phosphate-mannose--protein O-mannosyl transferase
MVRATSTIGNILLWFATTGSMILALAGLGRAGYRWLRRRQPIARMHRQDGLALLGMLALTLPFIVTHRQSYIFHYLGAYGLGLGLLAGRLERIGRKAPAAVLGFVLCATVVSMIYLPLWTGAPQSARGFLMRLPFGMWR